MGALELGAGMRRHREAAGAQFEVVKVDVAWDKDWRFDRVVPMSLNAVPVVSRCSSGSAAS